jgi:arylsulfatase A-like enzyme
METDAALGRVMQALEDQGLAGNTLLIFTSDNGHCSYTPIQPFIDSGHRVGGPFRGYKGFVQEGGIRVPLVIRWPGKIEPGTLSNAMVNTVDLMATCAEITDYKLPSDAAEDSFSLLPLLTGKAKTMREEMITHSYFADCLVIRKGPWKLALSYGSGAPEILRVREPGIDPVALPEAIAKQQGKPPVQLYNIESDPEEYNNVQNQYSEIIQELLIILQEQIRRGRSTPGLEQENDRPIRVELH